MVKRVKTLDQLIVQDMKDLENKLFKQEQILNQKELERLQKVYPLFKFSLEGKVLNVQTSKGSSFNPWMKNGRIEHEATMHLDRDHMQKSMSITLMKLYPDLYIHVYPSKNGCEVSVWVNRPRDGESDDAESIGTLDICSNYLHRNLLHWQKESYLAKQEGWFFCSGHSRAEMKTEGHYFHFAGNYCKQWGEEHPADRLAAMRETYE